MTCRCCEACRATLEAERRAANEASEMFDRLQTELRGQIETLRMELKKAREA